MDLQFIGNACEIITSTQGATRLLCDPLDPQWCVRGFLVPCRTANEVAGMTYAYERRVVPASSLVRELVGKAEHKLRRRLEMLDVFPEWNVSFRSALDGSSLGCVSLARSGDARREMTCTLDDRLLLNILERNSHWDNAQIGSHIRFSRNCHRDYSQEVHTLLSFLHL